MANRTRTGRRHPVLAPAVLAVLTACLMAPSTPASAGSDVNFKEQVGLATVIDAAGTKRPVEFAVDTQGRMWEFEQSGSGWTASDRGIPSVKNGPSTGIRAGAGAVGVWHGVRAYVVGKDGNLWEFVHDGDTKSWSRFERPPGAKSFVGAVGTEATRDGMPVVVVRDSDQRLWQYRYGNGRWTTNDLGTLPAKEGLLDKSIGLGMSSGDVASPLTISNRNVVFDVDKSPEGQWRWNSWGTPLDPPITDQPVLNSLGLISYRDGLIRAFVRTPDGHAWRITRSMDAYPYKFEDLGAPPAVPLKKEGGGGASAIPTGEQVTAVGEDGKLWNTIAGEVPSRIWYRTDTPKGVTLDKELGSRNVANNSYTFVVDSEGDMRVAKYSPADNQWTWPEVSVS